MFFVRLAGTLPILVLVVFCLQQYGRERRAEEEYAFKSAISLSLVPYKDLIERVIGLETDPEYSKFLTDTIRQIYNPPRLNKEAGSKSEDTKLLKGIQLLTDFADKLVDR